MTSGHFWSPISDLPNDPFPLASPDLAPLFELWREHAAAVRQLPAYTTFLDRLRRHLAIETGIIENLYLIDRGVTETLIQKGIHEALILHESSNRPAAEVVAMIQDHEKAIDALFVFVASRIRLTKGYLREIHKILTAHQQKVEAVNMEGEPILVELVRGEWKKWPNNPTRRDTGWLHEYCPPEQVDSEIERLLDWHEGHLQRGVPPEVEAAWLHHRFTQIHPFQDGNGRVARCLASLVFLRAEGFPLVIAREDRPEYIAALESADAGNLEPLVELFAFRQRRALLASFGILHESLPPDATVEQALDSARESIRTRRRSETSGHDAVIEIAKEIRSRLAARLEQVSHSVAAMVQQLDPSFGCNLAMVDSDPDLDKRYRFAIRQSARELGYDANMYAFHDWVSLSIITLDRREILFACHALGEQPRGILVISAIAFQQIPEEGASTNLRLLHRSPFAFTYQERPEVVLQRLNPWLEECLVAGLEYWRKEL